LEVTPASRKKFAAATVGVPDTIIVNDGSVGKKGDI
jgi:hypothetical protein